jgi:hypothetical protein
MITELLKTLKNRVETDYEIEINKKSQKVLDVEARACFVYIAKNYLKIDYERISRFSGLKADTCKNLYYKLVKDLYADKMVSLRVNHSLVEFKKDIQNVV